MAAPATGKKLFGLSPKVAIIVFIVVGVGVFLYMRNRSANAAVPTQTQTTPQVAATGTDPNATGGVTQAATPDISGILDALVSQTNSLASNYQQPSNYFNAPYQSPTTSEYTYNYSGTAPAAPAASVNSGGGYAGLPPGQSIPAFTSQQLSDLAAWKPPVFNSTTIATLGNNPTMAKAS